MLSWGAEINVENKQQGNTPLHHAAKEGSLGVVEGLLEVGAKVNAADPNDGATALMLALRFEGRPAAATTLFRLSRLPGPLLS